MRKLINHDLVSDYSFSHIGYEKKPVLDNNFKIVKGLYQIWITLQNEKQLNSYTTEAIKEIILAFRRASIDRENIAVIFTATGTRSFCTGGNTAEYASYYSNKPLEYLQYMRLFNDMITNILLCDKPVICRVNGMRIGGGQEIGMACDFSISGDHARFGQAGPKHGSSPDGGSTDFLHLYLGYSKAIESLILCETWSAHKAMRLGLLNEILPVYKTKENKFIPNPFVISNKYINEMGQIIYGDYKNNKDMIIAKEIAKNCTIDLSLLDKSINKLVTKIMLTFPDCTRKSIESLRKKKLEHWHQNSESNRSWLSLNMNTEAAAGFNAFHYGNKNEQEINFIALRKSYAEGRKFDNVLINEILPKSAKINLSKKQT